MRITIESMAVDINELCKEHKYFYAYGLLKETLKLWDGDNYNLLCNIAQIMRNKIKKVV